METLDKLNLNKTCGGNLKKNSLTLSQDSKNQSSESLNVSTSQNRRKAFPMPVNGNYYLKGPITRKAPQSSKSNNVELPKYCSYTPNHGFFCNKLDVDKSSAISIKSYNNNNEKQAMFSTSGGWCGSSSDTPGKIVCKDNDVNRFINFDPNGKNKENEKMEFIPLYGKPNKVMIRLTNSYNNPKENNYCRLQASEIVCDAPKGKVNELGHPAENLIFTLEKSGNTLFKGDHLFMGDKIVSSNGKYYLTITKNHSLLLYDTRRTILWQSPSNNAWEQSQKSGSSFLHLHNSTGRLTLEWIPDGENFLDTVRNFNQEGATTVWDSGITGGNKMTVENDGSLTVKDASGNIITTKDASGNITEIGYIYKNEFQSQTSNLDPRVQKELDDNQKICSQPVAFYEHCAQIPENIPGKTPKEKEKNYQKIWNDSNTTGKKVLLSKGSYTYKTPRDFSSIQIPKGCSVRIYTGPNYTGEEQRYIYDKPCLSDKLYNMSDKIQSIKIEDYGYDKEPELIAKDVTKQTFNILFMFVKWAILLFCGIYAAALAYKNEGLKRQLIPFIPAIFTRIFGIIVYFMLGIPIVIYNYLFKT